MKINDCRKCLNQLRSRCSWFKQQRRKSALKEKMTKLFISPQFRWNFRRDPLKRKLIPKTEKLIIKLKFNIPTKNWVLFKLKLLRKEWASDCPSPPIPFRAQRVSEAKRVLSAVTNAVADRHRSHLPPRAPSPTSISRKFIPKGVASARFAMNNTEEYQKERKTRICRA